MTLSGLAANQAIEAANPAMRPSEARQSQIGKEKALPISQPTETTVALRRLGDMPKYYFHLFNSETIRDGEGEEVPSTEVAMASAQKMARGMAAQSVRDEGQLTLHHRIEVADEAGKTIGTVRFGDVVQIRD